MTKRCKLIAASFTVFSLFAGISVAQNSTAQNSTETNSAAAQNWVIAAMPFAFSQSRDFSDSEKAVASELPSLILGQLSENLERMPDVREIADRKLRDLRRDRQSIFLQISSEMQGRDSLVLANYSTRELRSRIKDADKKIAELRKNLDENLSVAESLISDAVSAGGVSDAGVERVAIYQKDPTRLFVVEESTKAVLNDFAFAESVVSAGINALICGNITIYGSHVSCAVEMYVYPGARVIGTASEIGSVDNLSMIAQSIAQQLQPQVVFELPAVLNFSAANPETASSIMLTIDDIVYTSLPESVTVHAGVHTLLFSADSFESVGTSYFFEGNKTFNVSVDMEPTVSGDAFLQLKNPSDGMFFFNATRADKTDDLQTVRINIDGRPVLGEFITPDGRAALFYVPEKLLEDTSTVTVNAKPYNRSDEIDKRRKWMYGAYSVFIVSLMPAFYTYGTFNSELEAYRSGSGNYYAAREWQTASWVSAGVSIGAAGFLVYELVRYLIAANSVLPTTAKRGNFNIK